MSELNQLPNPDMDTTYRLMGCAKLTEDEVGGLSASILSAVVCFLVGSVGPEKTAEILRDWAAAVARKAIKEVQ